MKYNALKPYQNRPTNSFDSCDHFSMPISYIYFVIVYYNNKKCKKVTFYEIYSIKTYQK